MATIRNRDGPASKEEGAQLSFGRHAAPPPGQEETGEPLPFFYGTPTGQGGGRPSPTTSEESGVIATYECDPTTHFQRVTLTLVGVPDDGSRKRLVHDLLWGRWARKGDDDAA